MVVFCVGYTDVLPNVTELYDLPRIGPSPDPRLLFGCKTTIWL